MFPFSVNVETCAITARPAEKLSLTSSDGNSLIIVRVQLCSLQTLNILLVSVHSMIEHRCDFFVVVASPVFRYGLIVRSEDRCLLINVNMTHIERET
jgi:hypothetical protein